MEEAFPGEYYSQILKTIIMTIIASVPIIIVTMIMTITFQMHLDREGCTPLTYVQKCFHRPLIGLGAAHLNQKVVVTGGRDAGGNARDEVELFI